MPRLTICADGTRICRSGRPHLLCADTIWSAFSDIAPGEWTAYLRQRRLQGFNALLISILPILHDRTVKPDSREPFAADDDGRYDYGAPNADYFTGARAMAAEAVEMGMTPILVLLWGNYVPGTWAADRTPWAPMPDEARNAYIELVARTFGDLEPIIAVSGDDHLSDPGPVAVFLPAMERIKQLAPQCLTTLHTTPRADPPAVLTESPALDFHIYQSGHHADQQDKAITLAERFLDKARRPIMNAEPCYEAIGRVDGEGRFSAHDVRRATWLSLLAGASAGIGYGAHGVWQWHRSGGTFNNAAFFHEPLTWQAALGLRGAGDVGYAASLFADFGMTGALPRQDLIVRGDTPLRVAERDGRLAAYTSFTQEFALTLPHEPDAVHGFDLDTRTRIVLDAKWDDGTLTISQPDIAADFVAFFKLR